MDDFRWTEQKEKAAQLVAAANLTYPQIAESVGVTRETVWAWRKSPAFTARVEEYAEEIRSEVRRIGIADHLRRVHAQNDRWNRMRRVIEARADDPSMKDVPGGSTGLLVRTTKVIGSGPAATAVDEYAVDTGLLKALLDHEKQAAQELGQWSERIDSKVNVESNVIRIVEVPGGFSPTLPVQDPKPDLSGS